MSYDTRLYLQKYLVQQFDPLLANSFQLVAGSNITLTPSGTSLTIASTASGSGGGSVTSFSAGNLSPLFTTSVATATTTPALSFTIAQAASGTFAAGPVSGANANIALRALATSDLPVGIPATKIGAGTVDDLEFSYLDGVTSAIQTQFAGKAANTEAFVTLGNTSGLTNERALTVAGGLTIQDNGANSSVVVSASALQPLDPTLTALAAYNTNGFVTQTGTDTFAGRTLAAGGGLTIQEVGTVITISGSAINGTVTSVAQTVPASLLTISGSPITGAGTLAIGLTNAASGLFWGGPSSGAATTPGYRSILVTDLPSTVVTSTGNFSPLFTAAISNQALSFTGVAQASGIGYFGPTSGANALPSFRALVTTDLPSTVAYTNAANSWSVAQTPNAAGTIDLGSTALPFRNIILGGAATNNTKLVSATTTAQRTVTFPDANSNTVIPDTGTANNFLTAISAGGVISKAQPAFTNISGTALETQGGTNQTTYATGDTLYASGANTLAKRTIGNSGDVLTVSGGVPVWSAPSAGGGFTASTITANATAAVSTVTFVDLASGNVTVALQTAVGQGGKEIKIKIINNIVPPNTLTITCTATNGAGTIDGSASNITSQYTYDAWTFQSANGSAWYIF